MLSHSSCYSSLSRQLNASYAFNDFIQEVDGQAFSERLEVGTLISGINRECATEEPPYIRSPREILTDLHLDENNGGKDNGTVGNCLNIINSR